MSTKNARQRGFTLIEILIVIGIIAILAAVVLIAINPRRQFSQAQDTQRQSNVLTILNAIDQYRVANRGNIPASITSTLTEICKTGASSCTGLVDLSVVTPTYVGELPLDPRCPDDCAANGTGYFVVEGADGRVTVDAPLAELVSVSLTR